MKDYPNLHSHNNLAFQYYQSFHFLNRQMNFDDERLEVSVYNSFYVGAAVNVNEKLNVGARLKAINGIANVNTKQLQLGFYTDSTSIPAFETNLQADVFLQTSGMGLISDSLDFNPMLNTGFAFDFGANYKYNEQLEFSFALNDIGRISWAEENNEDYTTDGQVEYIIEGITQSSSGAEDLEAQIEEITGHNHKNLSTELKEFIPLTSVM